MAPTRGRRVIATGIGKSLDFAAARARLAQTYAIEVHHDAICIAVADAAFVFAFGVVVCWGLDEAAERALVADVTEFAIEPHATPYVDELTYEIEPGVARIRADTVTLPRHEMLTRLGVSYALAQAVELDELEAAAQRAIDEVAHIPREMAERGRVRIGRRQLGRLRGRLFLAEYDIDLNYALLDTPDFFWDFPEQEDVYQLARQYLEVGPRTELLGRKLGVIGNLVGILSDEQQHKHSSLLEWIIIWLIAVEIVMFVGYDLLDLF
jgi:uncharacterized Rmd1/YagE family protein